MKNIEKINKLFSVMKIGAKVDSVRTGLRTQEYLIKLDVGERVSKIRNLTEELSLLMNSIKEPLIKLDTTSGHVVIETVITTSPLTISLESIIGRVDLEKYTLPLVLGQDMYSKEYIVDLAEAPHLLIGGTTGAGKSVLCETMLCSLAARHSHEQLQFILVDPKGTELSSFEDSPHCTRHLSTIEESQEVFSLLVQEMERRYQKLSKKGIKHIKDLPASESEPYIVILIDELADLLLQDSKKSIFNNIVRLLQKARAAGIHIIANTQRPDMKTVPNIMKNNMNVRIALKMSTRYDSRTILDEDGAERLVGKGDMLVKYEGKLTRVQGAIAS